MFERYTEKARRAIFFARYEASVSGSSYIEAEHLFLALMREDKALFARLLPKQTSATALSEKIRDDIKTGPKVSTSVDIPLANTIKRVLAYGAEEAERLRNPHIAPAHLLLGLLREQSNVCSLLGELGLHLNRVREDLAVQEPSAGEAVIANMAKVRELQNRFGEIARRLTPDVEPAVAFVVSHSVRADSK